MASFAAACRLSARLTARQLRQDVQIRGFRTSSASLAAQNFTMPALSPTMTEGNIAKWNVKEGDSFSAGDVLLEIETDKASMDVEAQDDGIMAKIVQGDGSKGIQVGTRIGVIAEPGDDLSSLEIPAEESAKLSPNNEAPKQTQTSSESQVKAPITPNPSSSESTNVAASKPSSPPKKQTYPLLPSVEHLLHEHGIDVSAIDKMTPSGPNNRLLKGDVLAYLGSISSSWPAELSNKIEKLSHLDLSNVKLAAPAAAPKEAKVAEVVPEPFIEKIDVATTISMKAVLEAQKRIETSLGVFLPLSTFISRATDLANDDLPRPKNYQPNADELFDQVLGLSNISSSTGVRGNFMPQIFALPSAAPFVRPTRPSTKKIDIIDILSGSSRITSSPARKPLPGLSSSANIFSVTVPKGDEKRAQVFLDRVKAVLESEPGRLVL